MTTEFSKLSRSTFAAIALLTGIGLVGQVVLTQPAHARTDSRDTHVEKVEKISKAETQKPEKPEKPETSHR